MTSSLEFYNERVAVKIYWSILYSLFISGSLLANGNMGVMKMFPKGRFCGYVAPDGSKTKIPTTLDLYIAQEEDEYKKLKGVLKFSLGGFTSHEYATYPYDDIHYSWQAGEIYLNADNHEVLIENIHYMHKTFMGSVSLSSSGNRGVIKLVPELDSQPCTDSLSTKLFPDRKVASSVSGEYRGRCGEKKSKLQIESSKWQVRHDDSSNFLNGYKIRGRYATKETDLCRMGRAYCVKSVLESGVANAFDDTLAFYGQPQSLTCKRSGSELDCGECRYVKQTNFLPTATNPITLSLEGLSEGEVPVGELPSIADVSGVFRGYLVHDTLGRKQDLSMRVQGYAFSDRPHRPELLHVAINAWLDFTSRESRRLPIDFKNRRYIDTFPHFLLEGDHGFDFLVDAWTNKSISGVAYSMQFGRIGRFRVERTESTSKEIEPFLPLAGDFSSASWHLNLDYMGEMGEYSEDAVFPGSVKGYLQMQGFSNKHFFGDVSYDLFMGRLAADIGEDRFLYLTQNSENELTGYVPAIETWGAVFKPYSTAQTFARIEGE